MGHFSINRYHGSSDIDYANCHNHDNHNKCYASILDLQQVRK